MNSRILFHGFPEIIRIPELSKGKLTNDFGQGFYCTEERALASEWACTEGRDGYVNQYEMDMDGIHILNLGKEDFTVLHWLTILIEYRKLRLSSPVMRRGAAWLIRNFHTDLAPFDMVIGYRADDSYFSFVRAFLSNTISLEQLSRAMKLGKLGEQIVLKSEKAFRTIRFVGCERAENSVYYVRRKARDESARKQYLKLLEDDSADGMYLRDLIREEVAPDDARIR